MTANGAQFENANLYGVLPRQILGGNINLADNNLSAVNAFGNPGMYGLKVNNNSLNQTEIDNILCALDMQNSIGGHLELQENTYPSRTGMIYINNLTSRGWTITYDQPPNIPADPNTTSPVAHWKSDNLDSTHNIIAFTSMSTNATSWQWSFGDGSPNSTLENPTHIYSNGLVHTVSLTVSNDAGSSTYTENVMKADPGVTWGNPANITYRIPLNRKQLNAAASVPGTFVYSPAPGTKLGIGSHTIYTTFTPTDYDNYYSVNLSKSINVTSGNIANYTANYTFSQENITGNTNLGVYLDPCFINSLTLNITNPFIDISTVNFGDYQKIITVDHTKVNTSLTDFPVLIAINNDTNLGSHALANGYDVKFKDSNGAYLNFEREYFEISDGECNAVFWVRIPVLSNITDTNITMIYGNVSATDSQNITGTWDTHFTGVYHLNQVPSETATQINDSTGNAVNGVANDLLPSNSANGKIGKGQVLATDDYITLTNEFMAGATSGTFSVWINPNTISGTDSEVRRCIIGKASNPDNGFGFSPTTNHIRGRIGPSTNVDGSTGINTGDWTFATLTWSSNDVNVYVNGSLDATGSGINVRWFNEPATYPTIIGRIYSGSASSAYDGYVDELQASNVSRSAGWIQTEYNNQYSPDNFYTISAEEMGSENSTYISLNPQTVNGKKVVIPGDYPWDVGYTFKTATNSSTVSYNNTTSGMLSTPYGVNDNAFSSFVTGKRETVNINGTVLPNGGLMYSPVLNINYTEPTDQVNETITDKSYVLNVSLSPDKNFSVMGNIVLTPSEDIQSIASNGKYTLVSNDVNATAQYDNNKNIIITTGALTSGTVYNYNLSIIKNSLQSQISKYVNAFLNFLLNHRLHVTEAIWQTL
jgi:PKD repeat protein